MKIIYRLAPRVGMNGIKWCAQQFDESNYWGEVVGVKDSHIKNDVLDELWAVIYNEVDSARTRSYHKYAKCNDLGMFITHYPTTISAPEVCTCYYLGETDDHEYITGILFDADALDKLVMEWCNA